MFSNRKLSVKNLDCIFTRKVYLLDQGVVIKCELYSKVGYPAALGPVVGDAEGGEVQQVHGLVLAPLPSSLVTSYHLGHHVDYGQAEDPTHPLSPVLQILPQAGPLTQ